MGKDGGRVSYASSGYEELGWGRDSSALMRFEVTKRNDLSTLRGLMTDKYVSVAVELSQGGHYIDAAEKLDKVSQEQTRSHAALFAYIYYRKIKRCQGQQGVRLDPRTGRELTTIPTV